MADYHIHTIAYGEDIHMIAQRYFDDALRWTEIVKLNNLEYPYITDDRSENSNVKSMGDDIIIPIDEEYIDRLPTDRDYGEEYEDAFGRDLSILTGNLINHTDDIRTEITSDLYGDLNVVRGMSNLRQSLLVRLSTPMGSLVMHPDYGTLLHELLGSPMTFENIHKIKIEIERTIRTDGRVDRVEFSNIVGELNTLRMTISVFPTGIDEVISLSLDYDDGGELSWV